MTSALKFALQLVCLEVSWTLNIQNSLVESGPLSWQLCQLRWPFLQLIEASCALTLHGALHMVRMWQMGWLQQACHGLCQTWLAGVAPLSSDWLHCGLLTMLHSHVS